MSSEIGRKLQAAYTAELRRKGHVLVPLTAVEVAQWHSGADMPGFSHICMDGDVVVGEKS